MYWNYSEKVKQKDVWIHTNTRGDELQYRHGDVRLIYGSEPTDTNAMRVKYYGLSPSRGGVPCGHYFVITAEGQEHAEGGPAPGLKESLCDPEFRKEIDAKMKN